MGTRSKLSSIAGSAALAGLCLCLAVSCGGRKTLQKPAEPGPKRPAVRSVPAADTSAQTVRNVLTEIPPVDTSGGMAKDDALVILSCNNYLQMFPESPKNADVLQIKASTYYNGKRFNSARESYEELLKRYPASLHVSEAMKMIAQSFYVEKDFAKAEDWYRKLRQLAAATGADEGEAVARLSEAVYRGAERLEQTGKLLEAAKEYERVAIEFASAKIADVSLINAGLVYEKLIDWSAAILMYSRLINDFPNSSYRPRGFFRIGKCYEKLSDWEKAAEAYLTLVRTYPADPLAVDAIYNAGMCFQNAENWSAAAKTFERMAELYPKAKDASNVLFIAGELYMKINDWNNVARINRIFEKNFGGDKERVVQALCMAAVAAKMQKRNDEAVKTFQDALGAFRKLPQKSEINVYYAAKAQFSIGEIYHEMMRAIKLTQPPNVYKEQLGRKAQYLQMAIENYRLTPGYKVRDWTTQSIYCLGQAFEDFGLGIFQQERPANLTLDNLVALETGIANAAVEYFVGPGRALPTYESNVTLGSKLNIEDRWILKSRDKLTMLPYSAAQSYTKLMEIVQKTPRTAGDQPPVVQIRAKLGVLQQIGPLQQKAIELYLKTLERGLMYQIQDEYVRKATTEVTSISYAIGETYREIVQIARSAPIPEALAALPYERFLYKLKLIETGIADYESNSLDAFKDNVGIARAYKLNDQWVDSSRIRIGQILLERARTRDVLSIEALEAPPLPADVATEEEKQAYKAQFEELGFKLQDGCAAIYRDILRMGREGTVMGEAVAHAYMRLYQIDPKQYGTPQVVPKARTFGPGPHWKSFAGQPPPAWLQDGYDDSQWKPVRKGLISPAMTIKGFKEKPPVPMWGEDTGAAAPAADGSYSPALSICIRTVLFANSVPLEGALEAAGLDSFQIWLNGKSVVFDSTQAARPASMAHTADVRTLLRKGKNIIAMQGWRKTKAGYGLLLRLDYVEEAQAFQAIPPGTREPLSTDQILNHVFPEIANFPEVVKPKIKLPG